MTLRLGVAGVFAIVALVSSPISAQWPSYPKANAPRTSDRRVNLEAPAPRTADGKPDFTGLWEVEIEVTVDDPKAYTRPWTAVTMHHRLLPDEELIEFVCGENEKSSGHFQK